MFTTLDAPPDVAGPERLHDLVERLLLRPITGVQMSRIEERW
jgi:hypothetical protein